MLGEILIQHRHASASAIPAIPVIGKITEGGAIVLGGIIGGLLMGCIGHDASKAAAARVWRLGTR